MAKKRKRVTVPGFHPSANPEQAHWMREFGKSSAASPHVPTPKKGTRRERERQAIRDQKHDQDKDTTGREEGTRR